MEEREDQKDRLDFVRNQLKLLTEDIKRKIKHVTEDVESKVSCIKEVHLFRSKHWNALNSWKMRIFFIFTFVVRLLESRVLKVPALLPTLLVSHAHSTQTRNQSV